MVSYIIYINICGWKITQFPGGVTTSRGDVSRKPGAGRDRRGWRSRRTAGCSEGTLWRPRLRARGCVLKMASWPVLFFCGGSGGQNWATPELPVKQAPARPLSGAAALWGGFLWVGVPCVGAGGGGGAGGAAGAVEARAVAEVHHRRREPQPHNGLTGGEGGRGEGQWAAGLGKEVGWSPSLPLPVPVGWLGGTTGSCGVGR